MVHGVVSWKQLSFLAARARFFKTRRDFSRSPRENATVTRSNASPSGLGTRSRRQAPSAPPRSRMFNWLRTMRYGCGDFGAFCLLSRQRRKGIGSSHYIVGRRCIRVFSYSTAPQQPRRGGRSGRPFRYSSGLSCLCAQGRIRTLAACGPFWPAVCSYSTFCPSFSDL